MTPEQQRAIIEAAAKACGIEGKYAAQYAGNRVFDGIWDGKGTFNPINNSADTASMCAKLEISTLWLESSVHCDTWLGPKVCKPHDGTCVGKEAAWRLAASMVAAKVGGYADDI